MATSMKTMNEVQLRETEVDVHTSDLVVAAVSDHSLAAVRTRRTDTRDSATRHNELGSEGTGLERAADRVADVGSLAVYRDAGIANRQRHTAAGESSSDGSSHNN